MGELINLNPGIGLTDADIPAAIARDAEYIAADAAHVTALHPPAIYGFGQGVSTENVFDYGSGFLDCRNGGGVFPPNMGHIQGFQARFFYTANKWGMQLVTQNNIDNECYFRTVNQDVWGTWRRIWNDGNFNPANYLSQTQGDAKYRQIGTALTDTDIPAAIARDAEVAAAVAAHAAAIDPHPVYLTQTEGDVRYPLYKQVIFTTASAQGGTANTVHGLVFAKILSFSSMVKIVSAVSTSLITQGGLIGYPGYSYSIHITGDIVYCLLHPTDSANILNCPITVNILYST